MKIQINDNFTLTPIFKKDKKDLVRYISHPAIAGNTLTIPYPYTPKDADWFLDFIKKKQVEKGQQYNWAIRNSAGTLIGSIGLLGEEGFGNPYRDAFGYWLAEDFWGKGIMTEVVQKFSEYCLGERGLHRLEASVFAPNKASMKVLEKAGFEREGFMKKAYYKNGEFLDTVMFSKTT